MNLKPILLLSILFLSLLIKAQIYEGDIIISTQSQIDNFSVDYPGITKISGKLQLSGIINNTSGLIQLKKITGDLEFISTGITNLNGLESLDSVGGTILFIFNSSLINLQGLKSLKIVGKDLMLQSNSSLTNLEGLDSLSTIEGALWLSNNTTLNSINGINNISSIGNILISSNNSLTNLTGLDNIYSIDGILTIAGNPSLKDLTGLNSLISVQDLVISNNDSLSSLLALSNLESIGDSLALSNNASLTSLSGLDNIDYTNINYITIEGSNLLSECEIQSICSYLRNPLNMALISENNEGCNSREEVLSACPVVDISELNLYTEISIYPNPAKKYFYIDFGFLYNGDIEIYTISGQIKFIDKFTNTQNIKIDISDYDKGIYLIKIKSEKYITLLKLIKN